MSLDRETLAELRSLLSKATPGPWFVGKSFASHLKGNPVTPIYSPDDGCTARANGVGQRVIAWLFKHATGHSAEDAALIVALRDNAAALLDIADRATLTTPAGEESCPDDGNLIAEDGICGFCGSAPAAYADEDPDQLSARRAWHSGLTPSPQPEGAAEAGEAYTLRETLAAMVLEYDAGGITLATLREARAHLSTETSEPIPANMQHVAYFDEGEFQWMSGIAPRDCDLYSPYAPRPHPQPDALVEALASHPRENVRPAYSQTMVDLLDAFEQRVWVWAQGCEIDGIQQRSALGDSYNEGHRDDVAKARSALIRQIDALTWSDTADQTKDRQDG